MSEAGSWNAKIVEEFRANNGRVGGAFEGAPLVLLHHRGRTSGKDYIAPVMYQAGEQGRMSSSRRRQEHRTTPTGITTSPSPAQLGRSSAPKRSR